MQTVAASKGSADKTDKFSFSPTKWLQEKPVEAAIAAGIVLVIGIVVIVVGTKKGKKGNKYNLPSNDSV